MVLLLVYNSKAFLKSKKFKYLVVFKLYLEKISIKFFNSFWLETIKDDFSEVYTLPKPKVFWINSNTETSSTWSEILKENTAFLPDQVSLI